jgi:hypothetical protein
VNGQGIADILLDEHETAQVARPGTSMARPKTGAQGVRLILKELNFSVHILIILRSTSKSNIRKQLCPQGYQHMFLRRKNNLSLNTL